MIGGQVDVAADGSLAGAAPPEAGTFGPDREAERAGGAAEGAGPVLGRVGP